MAEARKAPGASGGLARWQRLALWAAIALLVASVAARAALHASRPAGTTDGAPQPASYLAPGAASADAAASDAGAVERSLPYVTEGTLFGLVGFALGYAARKVFKLALVLIALAFLAVQSLVWFDVIAVDWGGFAAWLDHTVLQSKTGGGVLELATRRVPSVGALAAGWFVGWRRG